MLLGKENYPFSFGDNDTTDNLSAGLDAHSSTQGETRYPAAIDPTLASEDGSESMWIGPLRLQHVQVPKPVTRPSSTLSPIAVLQSDTLYAGAAARRRKTNLWQAASLTSSAAAEVRSRAIDKAQIPKTVVQKASIDTLFVPTDLIRDSAAPRADDSSERAQIVRCTQTKAGRKYDFTWSAHYHIVRRSMSDQLIAEINRKLSTGLGIDNIPFIREVDPDRTTREFARYVNFARAGMQSELDWRWCWEHMEIMRLLGLEHSELGLTELDALSKATGAWMIRNTLE